MKTKITELKEQALKNEDYAEYRRLCDYERSIYEERKRKEELERKKKEELYKSKVKEFMIAEYNVKVDYNVNTICIEDDSYEGILLDLESFKTLIKEIEL